ncbi:KDO2-lipid IV(A) lauroyltransferase [Allonocardiopsis opalescens]|uniref:KDO2-lipid IV(A) lauroyltransferase n=1 Tax=Allonocardiopsis opalescens TaxID=1144618 RepID=A0A2T0PWZ3_9ACTN|nr:KDO2-lipid IV(A) lauroyltransferase [Allonocardiopsis opalescens]
MIAVGYLIGWGLIRWLPERWGRRLFTWIADAVWRREGRGVRRLEANLRRVVGPGPSEADLRALSRSGMRSYLRYWYEIFRLPSIGPRRLAERTEIHGADTLFAALESGRGVVAALPHSGNWDQAGAWIVGRGYRLTTVAERLRPESVFERFVAFRTALGMEVLALRGGPPPLPVLVDRLKAGGLVCLLADRDLSSSGVEVTLFGEPARMPAGPATLALRTGAALLPVGLWFTGKGWGIRIHDEIEVPDEGDDRHRTTAMTQALARAFESDIAAHPQDWHMLQRVFSADLDPRRARRAARPDRSTG